MAEAGIIWMICLLLLGGIPPLLHPCLGVGSHPGVSSRLSSLMPMLIHSSILKEQKLFARLFSGFKGSSKGTKQTAAVAAQGWEGKSSCNSITITPKVNQGPSHFSDSWLRAWSFSCSLLDSNFPCKIYPIYISPFRNLFKNFFLTLGAQTLFLIESSEMVLKNPLLSPST